MFSLNNTEKVFEDCSNFKLWVSSILLGALSKNRLGKLIVFALRFLPAYFGRHLMSMFSCESDFDSLKKIVEYNHQNRVSSLVFPLCNLSDKCWDTIFELVKSDYIGLKSILFEVENYIDERILNLVLKGGLLNTHDKADYQLFLDRLDNLCSVAEERGKSVVIFTKKIHLAPYVKKKAVSLMQKYNKENVTVYFVFQLCLAGVFDDIVELVHSSVNEDFKPGIAITKFFVEDNNKKGNDMNGGVCHSFTATKRTYRDVTKYLLNNIDNLSLKVVSHNPSNLLFIVSLMDTLGIGPTSPDVVLAQRYGMAPHISYNLAASGFNSEIIIPFGKTRDVLAHLQNLYRLDPSLPLIFAELNYAIRLELKRRKLENKNSFETSI
ncbi:MAG: proline dehydrogenase [Tenuifilum sp.]|jgi:proline dehydrogenase|uniref:proline dehydrogenase family protein n=1 Tax=Tenuifilum sp. TaxID=2760880 RepID=UPI0024AAD22C|nr:proline dehydrogenase family protein [Tenuifilum sp.]MDI3526179.1 proline dehydrogenase [Tenuifilum sp.]